MPTLNIEGRKVKVGDDFLKLSPEKQNETVDEIARSLKIGKAPAAEAAPAEEAPTDPVGLNEIVRSTATGVPVFGGLANTLNAATAAVAAPAIEPFLTPGPESINQAPGATAIERLQNRYRMSKAIQEAKDAKMAKENPILDTGLKIAGGVGGTIPAVLAAPKLFGAAGTLPQMVKYGAGSGAALSAADAAIRGEDVPLAAAIGGGTGAAAPLVGRAIGAGYRAIKGSGPPVAANTIRVGTQDIPIADYQVTGDIKGGSLAERASKGSLGDRALAVRQGFDEAQESAVTRASDEIAAGLDPTGVSAATKPADAGAKVVDDLVAREAAKVASETAEQAGVRQEGAAVRGMLGGNVFADEALAPTASEAAEAVSSGVTRARDTAVTARNAAYRAANEVPGEFHPSVGGTMSAEIKARGATGDAPLFVSPDAPTSAANQALRALDETVGGGLFANKAAPGATATATGAPVVEDATVAALRKQYGNEAADAYAKQNNIAPAVAAAPAAAAEAPPLTMRQMDQGRKRLVAIYGDARRAAMTNGNWSDVHAVRRIMDEFDNVISDAFKAGKFSGDAVAAQGLMDDARAAHAAYRQTFTPRGPGDPIGRDVEKILGRYTDTALPPDEVAKISYGPQATPGGARATMVAQRLRSIVGETSPEWGGYKQGLFSHLTDVPEGMTRSGAKTADRIDKYLVTDHARMVLSDQERTALASYSRNLRAADTAATVDSVEKTLGDIAGRNGGIAYSPDMVVGLLLKDKGKGSHLATLTSRLQRDLTPEGWTAVRQGMWTKITERGGGGKEFEAQALATRIGDFLDSDVAKIMYSEAERKQMSALQKAYKQMIPLKGTTNPSGTEAAVTQVAKRAGSNILAMLGLLSGGVTGAATGFAIEHGSKAVVARRAAKQATQALYGKQAKAPIRTSRIPIVLSQGLSPSVNQQHPAQ